MEDMRLEMADLWTDRLRSQPVIRIKTFKNTRIYVIAAEALKSSAG